jgi:FAD/FMN-containing dehydrogenase
LVQSRGHGDGPPEVAVVLELVESELGHLLSRDTPSFRDAVDPQDVLAFVHRNELFLLQHTVIVDPDTSIAEREAARRWLEQSWGMVHPWGSGGVYPNWPDPDLEDWEHAYHGANDDRLVGVKARYDPDGSFSFHQSIPSRVPGNAAST